MNFFNNVLLATPVFDITPNNNVVEEILDGDIYTEQKEVLSFPVRYFYTVADIEKAYEEGLV